MNDQLHVLNGDATLRGFEQAGIEGDTLVWREVLSEGPLMSDISSAEFWKQRCDWICKIFDDSPEQYQKNVVEPLEKLSMGYQEITLWFEFDLHCQVNLLGVLMLLNRQTDLNEKAVYLVSPAEFHNRPDFKGMGELNGEELAYLYDNIRVQLSDYDFVLASEAWEIYFSGDAQRLQEWLGRITFWANLSLLKPALEAHLKRITENADGLNYIQQKLLDIYNNGVTERARIYQAFWQTEKIYGFGDSQIDFYLQSLVNTGRINLL